MDISGRIIIGWCWGPIDGKMPLILEGGNNHKLRSWTSLNFAAKLPISLAEEYGLPADSGKKLGLEGRRFGGWRMRYPRCVIGGRRRGLWFTLDATTQTRGLGRQYEVCLFYEYSL